MDKRFDDMNKRFDSLESQIHVLLAEIRELRGLYYRKVDIDSFRELENKYLGLLKELTLLKQKSTT